MRLEIIDSVARLHAIGEAWSRLAQRTPYPMLQHRWMLSAAEAYEGQVHLQVFALWDGESLVALAPLARFHRGPAAHLQCLARDVGEPDAFLYADRAALDALVLAILRQGLALKLSHLSRDGSEYAAVKALGRGALSIERSGSGHAALLPATQAQLDEGLSKSARTMLRRKQRRAEKFGSVQFLMETLQDDNRAAFLQDLVQVEASGWKGRNKTSLSHNEGQRRFFDLYLGRMAPSGALRGDRMLIDGRTVAIRLGLRSGGRLYELKIGFDEAFEACSPGILLTHETLKASIAEGLTVHEFLGVGENWQRHWPLRRQEQVTVRRYPPSLNGACNLGRDAFAQLGGRVARALAARR
ncbi:GNAT family N-acetyltransferase [Rhizobium sp. SSA_523]|uniref:GNAT family N-acetyltransferase n=1 Tax=Rhizobium sp. SSA_523 TaxID=2952477 RepID=UPI00209108CF|nr:GNAT family N-acetyltransferase [Rhizobium sp. SSA_523]MCO5734682.1 GNAT family N-acetyltransferase [Rhizobium sp. SSA_523]WKC20991.1 GNAT family N-acetyltransferase [Rhizobium sp. SSA_523]